MEAATKATASQIPDFSNRASHQQQTIPLDDELEPPPAYAYELPAATTTSPTQPSLSPSAGAATPATTAAELPAGRATSTGYRPTDDMSMPDSESAAAAQQAKWDAMEDTPGCCFSESDGCCFSEHGACCFSDHEACCFSDHGACCFSDHGACCFSDNEACCFSSGVSKKR